MVDFNISCLVGKARCYSHQSCWRALLPTQEMKGWSYSCFPPPFGVDFGLGHLLSSPQLYMHGALWSWGCPLHCVGSPGRRYSSFSCWFWMAFVSTVMKWELFVSSFKKREIATRYMHLAETFLPSFSLFSLFPSESCKTGAWLRCSWLDGRE